MQDKTIEPPRAPRMPSLMDKVEQFRVHRASFREREEVKFERENRVMMELVKVERFLAMAVDKVQEEKGIPLADFLRDFHEAPFELIDGKRIPLMVSLAGHTMLIHAILDILKAFVLANQLGIVLSEATIIEEERKNWVKGSLTPDLLFFSAERFNHYIEENADWEDKPFVLVPDIAIEVVSKNDSYSDINEKVLVYLELGVKEIWVIDPQAKNALIHKAKVSQMLSKEKTILSDLLPNFELKLSDLFSKKGKK